MQDGSEAIPGCLSQDWPAHISSAKPMQIIVRHLLPGVTSFLVVSITLAIPGMILGETTLSFLGLGITAPDVSWGSLLQDAQDINAIANYPWLLAPVVFVMLAVVLFNFIGDGLRDAADPYSRYTLALTLHSWGLAELSNANPERAQPLIEEARTTYKAIADGMPLGRWALDELERTLAPYPGWSQKTR